MNPDHTYPSLDAEQDVLGSMLIDSTCIPDLLQRLNQTIFPSRSISWFFRPFAT